MFDLNEFKSNHSLISNDFQFAADELKRLDIKSKLDGKTLLTAKDYLKESEKQQKEQIREHEDDNKKYKILQRYSFILLKVQELLNIIPSDLDSLSLEELNTSLENLLSNRKKISNQTSFTFYQNLFTDTINNILQIEKDYQEGKITPQESLTQLSKIQNDLKSNQDLLPASLEENYSQINELLDAYTTNIAAEKNKSLNSAPTPLKETDLTEEHKATLEKLNNSSQELLHRVSSLNTALTDFTPQVNLNGLLTDLSDAHKCLEQDVWDADAFSYTCTKIETTTGNLTNEQTQKNKQQETLHLEIKALTNDCNELGNQTIKSTTSEIIKQADERAESHIKSSEEIIEILEIDKNFPIDLAIRLKKTLLVQLDADTKLKEKLSRNPELLDYVKLDLKNEEVEEKLINLQEYIEKLEMELSTVHILKYDENDDTNK